ncbi:MAG TPA: alpha-amylase family glycosyl hydrolase [Thermotogota bacterium]|nr:alpha-amylase family glycosyl hydrolase [Thermotogota bacterium]HRW92387.1 alpha-amylase family glycosyl hydrolase [Thermotogota bacterium]
MRARKSFLLLVSVLLCLSAFSATSEVPFRWEDQVIYFLMTDRFANGDTSNDVQTESGIETGTLNSKYNGGDLQGLIDSLDYIQALGATAIWITPPVSGQWWDESVDYGGYHGYWARDFSDIDPHIGDIALYEEFIRQAHARGMRVIQDIVCNHTGNFFHYDPSTGVYSANTESVPADGPLGEPFCWNDFNDPEQRAQNVYHWPSEIEQLDRRNSEFADLDDLNTENPLVRDALKGVFRNWIDRGIDGYRVDTVIYVEDDFWPDFLLAPEGIFPHASAQGKDDFLVYGEAWVTPAPFENNGEQLLSRYFELGFNAMLDFPLLTEIHRVFKEGKPTELMAYRLEQREQFFAGKRLITFVDNHDMARFLKGAQNNDLKQALTLLFTIPGIPCIYYGTEQGFVETRATMFAGGFESGGVDHFVEEGILYAYIQKLTQLRAQVPDFREGKVEVLYSDAIGPGPLLYRVDGEQGQYLVLMNTSPKAEYASGVQTGWPEGSILEPVLVDGMMPRDIVVERGGVLNRLLDAKAIGVFRFSDRYQTSEPPVLDVDISGLSEIPTFEEDFVISGTSRDAKKVRLYFDGVKDPYAVVDVEEDGSWSVPVTLADFVSGEHRVFAKGYGRRPIDSEYSPTYRVNLQIPIRVLAEVSDPEGDDTGPSGTYLPPKGEGGFLNQMDIRHVTLSQIGQMLKIEMQMTDLTSGWTPNNGFDHVTFQLFFDDPSKVGAKDLPMQQAQMPEGMDWDYEIYATGWSIAVFSSEGAGPDAYGVSVTPAPSVRADDITRTVTLFLPMETLGTTSLEGWKLYVTTFDYDGIEALLRPVSPNPGKWGFTAPSENAPKIMDDALIEIH